MSETPWTPGPWSAGQEANVGEDGAWWVLNDDEEHGQLIARLTDRNAFANARLIAAAPELVAALEEVVALAQWMSGSGDFAPEGKAHEGWVKQRPDLFAAMSLLARIRGEASDD